MERECSFQEAVYHIMPELWLRKTFSALVLANSNISENCFCLNEREIEDLPENSTDIFIKEERYVEGPNLMFGVKYAMANQMCYAEFL